jgi:hypothetical protein
MEIALKNKFDLAALAEKKLRDGFVSRSGESEDERYKRLDRAWALRDHVLGPCQLN